MPTAAGLASSASGLASMAFGLARALKIDEKTDLSPMARLGLFLTRKYFKHY